MLVNVISQLSCGYFEKYRSNTGLSCSVTGRADCKKESGSIERGGMLLEFLLQSCCSENVFRLGSSKYGVTLFDGVEHGVWHDFHENGRLAAEGNYEQGKEIGEWQYWDNDGMQQSA